MNDDSKGFLKYLNYKYYRYGGDHDDTFARFDAKVVALVCLITCLFMGGILAFILIRPEFRYDSGLDNMPKLIAYTVLGLIGTILAAVPLGSEKAYLIKCRIARSYMGLLFLSLAGYSFLMTDAKADAIFTYLIYCFTLVALLHVNPVAYALQTLIYLIVTAPIVRTYFDSLGAMFSYIGLMFGTVFLVFYSNISVKASLKRRDMLLERDRKLKAELAENQLEAIHDQLAMQENIILAIADLVENRDLDTGTHIKATAFYAKLLADGCIERHVYSDTIDEDFAYLIEKAAPMHDLGKISVPDAILKAPRRLTDQEFEAMKAHTDNGADLIRSIYAGIESEEYIEMASNIARCHHERWDGKGYLHGLKEREIPLEARIMAIADVFDALTSKRCYKEAFPISEAFDEIANGSGTQFDPDLVEVFLYYKSRITDMIVKGFED